MKALTTILLTLLLLGGCEEPVIESKEINLDCEVIYEIPGA